MFIAVLFTIAKIWKQPKCPLVDEWNTTMEYLYSGILLSHKKKKTLPFATVFMDVGNIMRSEVSQSEKNKYHMISLTCGI